MVGGGELEKINMLAISFVVLVGWLSTLCRDTREELVATKPPVSNVYQRSEESDDALKKE